MDIHPYSETIAREIADLFYQAVHAIDSSIYSQAQKQVWAPEPINYEQWFARLNQKKPYVAIINQSVAGFIELDDDGHIDCTYTHPDYQGMGVATSLYKHVLAQARKRNLTRLYVEASLIAKPFFEKQGFAVVKKNELIRGGITLENFIMEKYLDSRN
ncbi:histone acetyltransferase [Marinomonas piezotolerans]|uniref:Histone acetyltransferase n=1 Tax=Marinomonas piezotolerans TaxID=2213058 RepID=A0A370U6Y9_9GAMM|nr:GNAT family N-acetyltransferase [Marinomonas piezotolerans]RDL43549.1 histone acetyltransferase [Marinomonas piezotolerans]